jgi:23S rRNA (adenine2030-N6)-methyltransferase
MVTALQQLQVKNWLNVSLNVTQPSAASFGMFGSGLYIINPPWTLPKILEESLPHLTRLLAQDDSASYQLKSKII